MPSLKAAKLEKGLQELQTFLTSQPDRHPSFPAIAQSVEQVSAALKTGKLSIGVTGQNSATVKAFQASLIQHKAVSNTYQLESFPLPQMTQSAQPDSTATLCYTNSPDSPEVYYPLSTTRPTRIGRNPRCDIFLETGKHAYASWHHTEIEWAIDNIPHWVIRDLQSSNGTYLNSKRLQGTHPLTSGDCFTLQPPEQVELEFQFECKNNLQFTSEIPVEMNYDVLFLVLESAETLLDEEQKIIQAIDPSHPAKLALVIPTSVSEREIKSHSLYRSLKTFVLPADQSDSEILLICEYLKELVKRKPEELLIARLTSNIQLKVSFIEQLLEQQEDENKQKLKRSIGSLKATEEEEINPKKILKGISDRKDQFFKRVKLHLANSQGALLDKYSPRSLAHKLSSFIESLEIVEFTHNGSKYLRLETEHTVGADCLHAAIIQFYQSELSAWIELECDRIYSNYEYGLAELLQNTHVIATDLTPNLSVSFPPLLQSADLIDTLQDPIVENSPKVRYPDLSIVGYMLKSLRTNWMAVGISISMIGALGLQASSKKAVSGSLMWVSDRLSATFGWEKLLSLFVTFSGLLVPIGVVLILSYFHEKNLKLSEASVKLRKDLNSYYLDVLDYLTTKALQAFGILLEAEERRLKELLDTINEQTVLSPSKPENSALTSRSKTIESLKQEQKKLQEEKVAFQKLKRLI
jgi:pSer/pThr/pTyr-binding forkhead associated (FHA) protein